MRRFLITSTKFTGTAEVFYNKHQVLCRIDCVDTDMTEEIVKAFKSALPATVEGLAAFSQSPSISKIVEAGYRVSFDEF